MMFLPRGIERYSVRPWRVWNKYKSLSSTEVQLSDQRGTCLVEKPAKDGLCLQQPLNPVIHGVVTVLDILCSQPSHRSLIAPTYK